ncbi:MAG: WcaI family glycosyltransferase [Flavobacteriaceae bacterium]|nr:WcaI family glycosyltransferase [Flavobacteriaceae bacterium]
MKQKNITFISLNYAPEDTAIGLYSTQWANYLETKGCNVSVITAFPYYPQWEISKAYENKPKFLKEEQDGIKVFRYKQYVPKTPTFFKRIIHLIDFTLGSLINLYKIKKCDLVIAVVPFTSSAFLGNIQKRRFKSKLWIHIQDFEFDAAYQTGVGGKSKWLFSLLFKLEKRLFKKADIASTISQNMLKKLKEKTPSQQFYLPNWVDENEINPNTYTQHPFLISNKIKILYSGNIGDKQDWELFIKFCSALDNSKYEITVVGHGSKKEWLINKVKDFKNISYYPPVPYRELSNLLCSADLHILFQKLDVLDTVMPSKVLGMMASAKPSLIIGNEFSEVKTIFEESQGGLYFNQFSSDIIKEIDNIFENKEKANQMGKNARRYIVEKFSKEKILSNMLDQINKM